MDLKKMKKVYVIYAAAVMLMFQNYALAITPVQKDGDKVNVSVEENQDTNKELSIIKRVSLKNKLHRSSEAQIQSFIKKFNKYSEKNELEKLKLLYSDSYVNSDGFDKKTIFLLMEEASDLYKDVKYTSEILDIKTNGNNATVKIHENAVGETTKVMERFNDNGTVSSDLYYTNYLRKENGKWRILAGELNSEIVTLKYGEAKKMDMTINAPQAISEGSEYEVAVKLNSPDGVFMVGSITNDEIRYPQVQNDDVLRGVKSDELTRILKANKDGYNEYATASIGITRATVEPPSVVINMTGMAVIMQRVNILPVKNSTVKEKGDK